jgi:hypothetical protein
MAKTKKQKMALLNKMRMPSIKKIVYPIVKFGASPIAFIDQISAKDRQILGSAYDNAGMVQKMKILTNVIMGRTTGINPFSSEYKAPQTINPSGIINKWTNGGAIGLLYGILGGGINNIAKKNGMGKIVPATTEVKQIGKSLIIGGALGGFFDDKVDNPHTTSNVGTRQYSMSNMPTRNTRLTTSSSSESAF